MKYLLFLLSGLSFLHVSCNDQKSKTNNETMNKNEIQIKNSEGKETATFGGGCYWCTEAIFQQLKGVDTVISGFSGGTVINPSYEAVCNGTTGHAEVIQITYDPEIISYDELLEVFWQTHDPTTLNRQGYDVGTQYRSVIFYHSDEQKNSAETYKKKLDEAGIYESKIVTEISAYTNFFPADKYHQNYYNSNKEQGYCRMVITPKLEKFKKVFSDKIR